MEGKDVLKYSLKRSRKVQTLPMKTSVKLISKGEATFVSDLIFQSSAFGKWLLYSFNDCKGHELRVYPAALFESII